MENKEAIVTILGYLFLIAGWISILNEYMIYSIIFFGFSIGLFISNLIPEKQENRKNEQRTT